MTDRLNEVMDRLSAQVSSLREVIGAQGPATNSNVVRLEGMGSLWHGIAIGLALGAVIVGAAWISGKVQELDARSRQQDAFQAAVYMVAPRLGEEIDKELRRRSEEQKDMEKP